MTQTTAENQVCNACGVEVRKGALFCYHCGGSIAPAVAAPKIEKADENKRIPAKKTDTENEEKTKPESLGNSAENESSSVEKIAEKPIPKPELQPENNLRSAASLRKKPKPVQKKKVEIIWQEHENPPNVLFVLAALLLAAFALAVMWLALYSS